ncbi:MAG: hypothetical protein JSS91_02475 [Bacteroidetes bacterium]|nr:hypothetical protein [Bacteroidota bacterium]
MQIKKYIAAVFIVFSLTFSYSSVSFSADPKQAIVYIIGSENDSVTGSFLNQNKNRKDYILTSLSIKIFLINSETVYFNTS